MTTAEEIKSLVEQGNNAFYQFKENQEERLSELEAQIQRNGLGGRTEPAGEKVNRERKASLFAYLRKGENSLTTEMKNSLSVGADPDGGYFVEPDTRGRIVQKIFESSPVRQVANVTTITTDALEGINDLEEADAGWVAETGERTDTNTPQVGSWRIPVHEQYAQPKATQKLLEDADRNVEDWLIGKLGRKFGRMEATAFVTGDGVGKPRGFLSYPTATDDDDTRSWGTLRHVPTGANGAFASSAPADVFFDTVFSLKPEYSANGVWLMNRATMSEVSKLKDGDGNYLLTAGRIDGDTPFSLLSYPVRLAEDMPDIANDSLSIAFGDFSEGYQIVDRLGISLLRDPFTQKGRVKFYTRRRVGGDVLNFDAIRLIKFAS